MISRHVGYKCPLLLVLRFNLEIHAYLEVAGFNTLLIFYHELNKNIRRCAS
jgi:hypothetical protein